MPMLFALLAGCAGEKEKLRLPDILLVTFDTTRADHLGCYGYVRDTSPRFDALAEQSILFERCIVPMAVTLPSHVSILTGTYPAEHGVKANTFRNERYYAFPPSLQPFAVTCREEGYETAAFVSAASLKRATGIDTGFDRFDQPETERRRAGATTDSALAWLERPREKPFFLWVHYFDPHQPVRPPTRLRELFRTDEVLESLAAERESPPPGDPYHAERREELLALLNGYDGEIRYMDEQFGRLVDAIDARAGCEETIILVVGDHGEGLYQHGILEHGGSWEEQLRAPMLLRVPGEPPRRVAEPVSAVDAIPTLLGFVEGRFEKFRSQASGRNVLAPGAAAAPVTSRDTGLKEGTAGYRYALTTERWKYFAVRTEGETREELYDIDADRYELCNLAGENQELVLELREKFLAINGEQEARGERLRASMDEHGGDDVDPATLEELKALGYVD